MVTEFLRNTARKVPMPRSLLGRMLLLTLLAVLFAQTLSSVIWVSQLRATQLEGLVTSARSLAHSMTASVSYFRSLPVAYRPLVLDQLRSMGGTRFVVTLNDRPLDMQVLPETPRKQAVLVAVDEVLRQTLGADVHRDDHPAVLGDGTRHVPPHGIEIAEALCDRDRADRLLEHQMAHAGLLGRDDAAIGAARFLGEPVEDVAAGRRFRARFGQDLALFDC